MTAKIGKMTALSITLLAAFGLGVDEAAAGQGADPLRVRATVTRARTSWARASNCGSAWSQVAAADDRHAERSRRERVDDRHGDHDRSAQPASARSWPRKTSTSFGFAWCPNELDARNSRDPGTGQGPLGSKPAEGLLIQAVPLLGRPAEFLGGVGRFERSCRGIPKVMRVGQELDFRIKVTGPAAWGMTDRPDLGRYKRLPAWPADRGQTG